MLKKIYKFFLYAVVLLVRPKEAADAVNAAESTEQLDEYILEISKGKTPEYKTK